MRLSRLACLGLLACLAGLPAFASADTAPDIYKDRILRVNFHPSVLNFHPHQSETVLEGQLFTGLYEGLCVYDPATLKPLPGAAASWTVSQDKKTWTFTLRPGLTFSDGAPLTAADFEASLRQVLNPKRPGKFAALLEAVDGAEEALEGKLTDPAALGIRALSPDQLELRLKEPAPQILSILCHYSFVPLHPDQRRVNDWNQLPSIIGNGPYLLSQRSASGLTLTKNPRYWDAAQVKIETIEVTFSDDKAKVTRNFKAGYYDWLADGVDFEQVLSENSIVVSPLFASNYLYFKSDAKPWNDYRVRRALTLLLPLGDLRKGQLMPSANLIPPFQAFPSKKGLEAADTAEAKKLLAEAGYPDGKGLPSLTFLLPDGDPEDKTLALVSEAWSKSIGLKVIPKLVPWHEYFARSATEPHTLGFQSWIGDFPDPMTFLLMWKSRSQLNSFGFSDQEYDGLLNKSRTQNGDERLETLSLAEERLLQRCALIPLGFTTGLNVIDTANIGGWFANPLDLHPFKNLRFLLPKALPNMVRLERPLFDFSAKSW